MALIVNPATVCADGSVYPGGVGSETDRSVLARRSEAVISERLGAETVVLNPTSGRYVRLNVTGSRLWESLLAAANSRTLAGLLMADWDLSAERAHADVIAWLESLADRGFVELTPPTRGPRDA